MSPAWSPDGGWIAFSMWGSIWRGAGPRWCRRRADKRSGYDYQPAYSPDGCRIVFTRDRDKHVDIWELADAERQITDDDAVDLLPSYTPEGEIIFYSSRAGNFDIWRAPDEPLTTERSRTCSRATPRWNRSSRLCRVESRRSVREESGKRIFGPARRASSILKRPFTAPVPLSLPTAKRSCSHRMVICGGYRRMAASRFESPSMSPKRSWKAAGP